MKLNIIFPITVICVAMLSACKPDPKASQEYKDLKAELDGYKRADSIENANVELYKKLIAVDDTTELNQFDELLADDVILHDMPKEFPATKQGFKDMYKSYFIAMPPKVTIKNVVAKGDLLIGHVNLTGVNSGPLGPGMPATGKSVDVDGFDAIRVENGKVKEYWTLVNDTKMMQQLGLMPEM